MAETNEMGLKITVKPAKPIEVELDLDALTLDDVLVLQKMDTGSNDDIPEVMKVISKVIGQDATQLPIRHLKPIITAVMDAIGASTSQGN